MINEAWKMSSPPKCKRRKFETIKEEKSGEEPDDDGDGERRRPRRKEEHSKVLSWIQLW